jgi:hypothetical protein
MPGGVSAKASTTRRALWRRGVFVVLAAIACAALVGSAAAAPASGGRHMPYLSLMNERVAIKKLPFLLRFSFRQFGRHGLRSRRPPKHGLVWFGEAKQRGATFQVGGTKHWLCDFEISEGEAGGGGGSCATLADVRRMDELSIDSCGGSHQYRINGLAPNGVTGIEVERSDGAITRTIPVVDNIIAFSIGHVDVTLRAVGDAAAERLERNLPLGGPGGSSRGGCSGYAFTEAAEPKG